MADVTGILIMSASAIHPVTTIRRCIAPLIRVSRTPFHETASRTLCLRQSLRVPVVSGQVVKGEKVMPAVQTQVTDLDLVKGAYGAHVKACLANKLEPMTLGEWLTDFQSCPATAQAQMLAPEAPREIEGKAYSYEVYQSPRLSEQSPNLSAAAKRPKKKISRGDTRARDKEIAK